MTTTIIHERDTKIWYHGNKIRAELPKEWADALGFTGKKRRCKIALCHSDNYGLYFSLWPYPQQLKQLPQNGDE